MSRLAEGPGARTAQVPSVAAPDKKAPFLDIGGRRVLKGLTAGAATGVLLTGVAFGGAALLFTPGLMAIGAGVFVFALAACAAIGPWFVGVFVFGPPIWMLGHRMGRTGLWIFALFGAVTPFSILFGLLGIALLVDPTDVREAVLSNLGFAFFVSGIGLFVGLAIRLVAYRPERST